MVVNKATIRVGRTGNRPLRKAALSQPLVKILAPGAGAAPQESGSRLVRYALRAGSSTGVGRKQPRRLTEALSVQPSGRHSASCSTDLGAARGVVRRGEDSLAKPVTA